MRESAFGPGTERLASGLEWRTRRIRGRQFLEIIMKLGFIGAGFIARFQAVAIEQVRGLEIAGLMRRRGSEALAAFCRSRGLGEAKIYDSIAEMAQAVDAIAILVPNFCRIEVMEQIVQAVKAGANLKGVILEKPLGL